MGKNPKLVDTRASFCTLDWKRKHKESFNICEAKIYIWVRITHRDEAKHVRIYTDVSSTHWSAVVTQITFSDLPSSLAETSHEPLSLHLGHFLEVRFGLPTVGKEASAVLAFCEREHQLVAGPSGFDLYVNRINLIFIFDPILNQRDIIQRSLRKVLRWAMQMSMYNYICILIRGVETIWADDLSLCRYHSQSGGSFSSCLTWYRFQSTLSGRSRLI